MADVDPFLAVKDEVQKTIETTDKLFHRWCEMREDFTRVSLEEYDWTTNELRNSLRSIDWDLDDLEETISIVEKNQKKFKIDASEMAVRRCFITQTRASVQGVRDHMSIPKNSKAKSTEIHSANPAIIHTTTVNSPVTDNKSETVKNKNKYTRLENEPDDSTPISHRLQTGRWSGARPATLLLSGNDNSPLPNNDHDEQTVMLGVSFNELNSSSSDVHGSVRKAIGFLHINWKMWTVIVVLLLVVAIMITLLFLL